MANENSRLRAAPLIRQSSLEQSGDIGIVVLLLALFVSLLFHAGLIASAMFLLPGPGAAVAAEAVPAQNEFNAQAEAPPDPVSNDPLTVTDIDPAAIEPDVDINYNADRKAEISVPGVVNL